jgi:hypothetical protein
VRLPLRRCFQGVIRWCVKRRLLPFRAGATPTYRTFRRGWTNGVPRTFNEKLRYKLMHDRRPLVRRISDKVVVRDYVRSLVPTLRMPGLLGVFATVADTLAGVPAEPWVMKAAHGSGMVLVGGPPDAVSRAMIARRAAEWLRTDYALSYWEWHYFGLPRRVLFEEHLGCGRCVPDDYKFYVIHRQVRLITIDQGRFLSHTRDLFRPDWTPIASRKGHAPRAAVLPPRPEQLPEMLRYAEALACDTDFVRVDLYVVGEEVYFGELTHAPAAGDLDFEDPALDTELGGYWNLPARYA